MLAVLLERHIAAASRCIELGQLVARLNLDVLLHGPQTGFACGAAKDRRGVARHDVLAGLLTLFELFDGRRIGSAILCTLDPCLGRRLFKGKV